MDIFDFLRGFTRGHGRDPFFRFEPTSGFVYKNRDFTENEALARILYRPPHRGDDVDDDLRHEDWRQRHPGSFDPPAYEDDDDFGFFGFREFGSPIDDIFRSFERHMDEMFGSFGFDSHAPPSAFGFGVIDGPNSDESVRHFAIEPGTDGAVESRSPGRSLRDEMLKSPGVALCPRVGDGDASASAMRADSDLDRMVREGGLGAVLHEDPAAPYRGNIESGSTRIMSKSVTTRRIGDKVVTVTETVLPDGRVETNRTVINMDEDELPKFERQWRTPFGSESTVRDPTVDRDERNALRSVLPPDERRLTPTNPNVDQDLAFKVGVLFRNVMDTFSSLLGR